jgi:excinuclease UvrABC ATPase subunit
VEHDEQTLRTNIADVLDMTIEEAAAFFEYIPHIARKMETLLSVGTGYLKLGQSALTLSGGEVLFTGTPEEAARCERSYTGRYLGEALAARG